MRFAAVRDMWPLACAVLLACSPTDPLSMESGHTTTTYGSSASASSSSSSASTDEPSDTSDDGEPNPTDTGPTAPPPPPPPVLDFGDGDGLPDGQTCTSDQECSSGNCYVIPFLGGYCGQCNEDADCVDGGCTPPNPFDSSPSYCNMGELGAGCQSDAVCMDGLSCSTAFTLLGLIELTTCGACQSDLDCNGNLCAAQVDLTQWSAVRECTLPGSLPQDASCELESNGNAVCASGICSPVDIMGLAQIGACGECITDADCVSGSCVLGEFVLDSGELLGSLCL